MRTFRRLVLAMVALVAAPTFAATCPFNIPVVTLPPQQVNGFSWTGPIRPMNDPCVGHMVIEPSNDKAWYVGGENGLYMTKSGGKSWTKPVSGSVGALYLVVAGGTQLVYAGVGNDLYLTRDHGAHWTKIKTFGSSVRSILVGGDTLFVGLGWNNHIAPSGVFTSNLGGGFMTFHAFGLGQTGLIVWTLARDPISGAIYAGTEIFDHPHPYRPPFFRSTTNGNSWTDVTGTLPWHVVDAEVRPTDGYVYALTEGRGLYGSPDKGATWVKPTLSPGLGLSLLMDPKTPAKLYAGRHHFGTSNGGIFLSKNAGKTFTAIGLAGVTVSDITMYASGKRIFAVAYASGIYSSLVP